MIACIKIICPGNLSQICHSDHKNGNLCQFQLARYRKTSTYYNAEFKFSEEQCVKKMYRDLRSLDFMLLSFHKRLKRESVKTLTRSFPLFVREISFFFKRLRREMLCLFTYLLPTLLNPDRC